MTPRQQTTDMLIGHLVTSAKSLGYWEEETSYAVRQIRRSHGRERAELRSHLHIAVNGLRNARRWAAENEDDLRRHLGIAR